MRAQSLGEDASRRGWHEHPRPVRPSDDAHRGATNRRSGRNPDASHPSRLMIGSWCTHPTSTRTGFVGIPAASSPPTPAPPTKTPTATSGPTRGATPPPTAGPDPDKPSMAPQRPRDGSTLQESAEPHTWGEPAEAHPRHRPTTTGPARRSHGGATYTRIREWNPRSPSDHPTVRVLVLYSPPQMRSTNRNHQNLPDGQPVFPSENLIPAEYLRAPACIPQPSYRPTTVNGTCTPVAEQH